MKAVITTEANTDAIENVYLATTKEEAIELVRFLVLRAYKDDIDLWGSAG